MKYENSLLLVVMVAVLIVAKSFFVGVQLNWFCYAPSKLVALVVSVAFYELPAIANDKSDKLF